MQRLRFPRVFAWVVISVLLWVVFSGPALGRPGRGSEVRRLQSETHQRTRTQRVEARTLPTGFSKVTPRLLDELEVEGVVDVLIFVDGRPDLRGARALTSKKARGRYVFNALRTTAQQTQASVRQLLDAKKVAYKAYWIANVLSLRGDRRLIAELAAHPDVVKIDINVRYGRYVPIVRPGVLPQAIDEAERPWGISTIDAPAVWGRGIRGQGIVVAGNDTGVDWQHEALKDAYRGWNGEMSDHNYNWHDAWNKTPQEPTDDHGHGTHTLGTVAGSGPHEIGVAPDARWIACRNMDNGVGTPASYVECFQFFLAPTDLNGDHPNPDLAPDVINNSWACIESEGCYPDDPLWEDTIRPAVEALAEAGIAVVVSAGNAGSQGCGSVRFPPAIYPQSLSVGAIRQDGTIAALSSRGPVTVDGSGIPAPDLVAPGLGVMSSVPGNKYMSLSGTSMASPHVAGTIALLWSAEPRLVGQLAVTEQILRAAAQPIADDSCGGDPDGHPNNVYGWGLINADTAVATVDALQELTGVVTDPVGNPLPATDVQIVDLTWGVEINLRTATDGRYATPLLPGDYRVVAGKAGYFAPSEDVTVTPEGPVSIDLTLWPRAGAVYMPLLKLNPSVWAMDLKANR